MIVQLHSPGIFWPDTGLSRYSKDRSRHRALSVYQPDIRNLLNWIPDIRPSLAEYPSKIQIVLLKLFLSINLKLFLSQDLRPWF